MRASKASRSRPGERVQSFVGRPRLRRRRVAAATTIFVVGRTGTGDHLQVVIASPCFDGLSLVEQHRLVYDPLAEPLADGTIDELRIRTKGVQ